MGKRKQPTPPPPNGQKPEPPPAPPGITAPGAVSSQVIEAVKLMRGRKSQEEFESWLRAMGEQFEEILNTAASVAESELRFKVRDNGQLYGFPVVRRVSTTGMDEWHVFQDGQLVAALPIGTDQVQRVLEGQEDAAPLEQRIVEWVERYRDSLEASSRTWLLEAARELRTLRVAAEAQELRNENARLTGEATE